MAKVLELKLHIRPSNQYSELISFRIDWYDLLAIRGTLKSLLQHPSSKSSVLRCSAFFTVQLSHPYMTTGKTIALTRWTFVGKVTSLFFNMLSRVVTACLLGEHTGAHLSTRLYVLTPTEATSSQRQLKLRPDPRTFFFSSSVTLSQQRRAGLP